PPVAQSEAAPPPAEPIAELSEDDGVWPELAADETATELSPAMNTARLYFGAGSLDAPPAMLERAPAEPEIAPAAAASPPQEADTKLGVLASLSPPADKPTPVKPDPVKGGETVAGKGLVTGGSQHPRSPAERLGLTGKSRAKAEKCLANAVYFESRG